jgi:hypothetical protein
VGKGAGGSNRVTVPLLSVPSMAIIASSRAVWSAGSFPRRDGAMMSLTLAHALSTPLPR